jgi:hypothetical protein
MDNGYLGDDWAWRPPRRTGPRDAAGKLDPIGVAGSIRTDQVVISLRGTTWGRNVAAMIEADAPLEGWCGFAGGESERVSTSLSFLKSVENLCEWKVLHLEEANVGSESRCWCRYFEVPKSGLVNRAILDCRNTNRLCEEPPPVRFASMAQVFEVFGFFGRGHYTSFDFRHFFYQIALPHAVRRLFTIRCGSMTTTALVWPMGFSWSPLVAQSISTTVIAEAMNRLGFTVDRGEEERSPPPVLIIRGTAGKIIGMAVIWYDNVMITMKNEVLQNQATAACQRVCEEWGVRTKEPHFVQTKDQVAFLGVELIRQNSEVMFRHVQKNIEEWSSLKDIPDRSLRGVARIIGIILWDWTVSGDAKNESASTLYVARDIGKQAAACADRGGWDQEATLTKPQIEDLKTSLRSILENPWRKRSPPLAALGASGQRRDEPQGCWYSAGNGKIPGDMGKELESPGVDTAHQLEGNRCGY